MAQDALDDLFARVRAAFAARDRLRQTIRVREGGRIYSLRCDDACFTVYRVNDRAFLPPGEPGLVVCRLEPGGCFSLEPGTDACRLPPDPARLEAARAWVAMAIDHLDRRQD